jgi:hypothetical protein
MPTITADGIYYVDLGSDPTFVGGSFVSAYPEGLQFDDMIKGVGNCSFAISFAAKDQDGATVVSTNDFVGPYRSYYRLRYGDVAIQAGPIVSTNTVLGSDFMGIAGKTWEHLLERWEYPFDGRPTNVNDYVFPTSFQNDELTGTGVVTPPGLVYQASNRDLIRIFGDLFSQVQNVPERITFDISSLTGLSGVKTNYQLTLGDNAKLFQIISDLSEIGDGFDWWISHDMKVLWATPFRFGNQSSPVITYTFDGSSAVPSNLQFTNNGPAATHINGRGAGLATATTLSRSFGYAAAQAQFSRLDGSYDFGDVRNVDELIARTKKQFSNDLNPQHDIPLSIDPLRISNFWSTFRKGRAIYIDYEMIAHRIDSPHQMISYAATVNNEGTANVDFTLQQIYDTSSLVGVAEG